MLRTFGYPYTIELATRPEKALGDPERWKQAEETLAEVLRKRGQEFTLDEGGGAFYGPKLDFKLIDAIGRKWQGPTVQLDFNLPERFGLEYTGADNTPHRPTMLHRVLVGSMERFVGGLIEHFAGAFPLWLAPEQVRVIPIADEVKAFAQSVVDRLKERNVRVHLDDRSETLNYRIRDGEVHKVPYMAVVGKREAEADSIALRVRGAGKKQEIFTVADFTARVEDELNTRALKP
jgi:threonyl-tRNA synthetase